MSDLIQRLRDEANDHAVRARPWAAISCREAADEIERLRAALAAPPAAPPVPVPEVATVDPHELRRALRQLAFMARTSGGTAGPDRGLIEALERAEKLLVLPYLPAATAQPAPAAVPAATLQAMVTALRFYANGEHYHCDEAEDFDSVSGEPPNWLCSGREDSGTMIEDGTIARCALQVIQVKWIDGDDDETPQPIAGEAWAAAPQQAPTGGAAQACPCFPGTCRGGEVVNGRLANGQLCAAASASGA